MTYNETKIKIYYLHIGYLELTKDFGFYFILHNCIHGWKNLRMHACLLDALANSRPIIAISLQVSVGPT